MKLMLPGSLFALQQQSKFNHHNKEYCLTGIGLKHLTKEVRELLGKMMAIDQNNYPETLYHTCIINAPAAFRIIWGAVKPMLNARTQEKVEVSWSFLAQTSKKWPRQVLLAD